MSRSPAEILADADLRLLAAAPGQELTWTCVPPGSGERLGVDRDQDGVLDRDELDVGSDPADAASGPPTPVRTSAMTLRDDDTVPVDPSRRRLSFRSARYQGMASGVVVPAWDGPGDPTAAGASGASRRNRQEARRSTCT